MILNEIGNWMRINGEAIYGTRPWKVFGEGAHQAKAGSFAGQKSMGELNARDTRFTRNKKGDAVYAIVLGWPEGDFAIQSFGSAAATQPGAVRHVEMLGSPAKLDWQQSATALTVKKPEVAPSAIACALKISLG